MGKLKSVSGTRWAFMQKFDIYGKGGLYLRRLRVIQTPLFAVYLHKVIRPDEDRELHDHPWSFIPIILCGGYVEQLSDGTYPEHRCGSYRVMRAEDSHRIVRLNRIPTWTLCLVGPRRREWGFYTDNGWVPWQTFLGEESAS